MFVGLFLIIWTLLPYRRNHSELFIILFFPVFPYLIHPLHIIYNVAYFLFLCKQDHFKLCGVFFATYLFLQQIMRMTFICVGVCSYSSFIFT